jgi:hypothetical protein
MLLLSCQGPRLSLTKPARRCSPSPCSSRGLGRSRRCGWGPRTTACGAPGPSSSRRTRPSWRCSTTSRHECAIQHVTISTACAVLHIARRQWPQPLVRQQEVRQLPPCCLCSCWAARRCGWSHRSRPSTTAACSGTLLAGLTPSGSMLPQVCLDLVMLLVAACRYPCPSLMLLGTRMLGDYLYIPAAMVQHMPPCCHAVSACASCFTLMKVLPIQACHRRQCDKRIIADRHAEAGRRSRSRSRSPVLRRSTSLERDDQALRRSAGADDAHTPPNQTPACTAQCPLWGCQPNLYSQERVGLTSVHLILLQAMPCSLAPLTVSKFTRLQGESRRMKQTRPRKLLPQQICRCECRRVVLL